MAREPNERKTYQVDATRSYVACQAQKTENRSWGEVFDRDVSL